MSAKVTVLIGGGPGATREANVALRSGSILLPLCSTGGAAAGANWDQDDPLECAVDLALTRKNAVASLDITDDVWDEFNDPEASLVATVETMRRWLGHII